MSVPLGWLDSTHMLGDPLACSELTGAAALRPAPYLIPAQLFIWERWSLQRGMVTCCLSFQDCLHSRWVCLSAMICKVCTQPAEATEVTKQLIIKPAFSVLLLEKMLLQQSTKESTILFLHQKNIQIPKVNTVLHLACSFLCCYLLPLTV